VGLEHRGRHALLKQPEASRWTVSVSLRNWFESRDYDLDFLDWLHPA
jgi:hypothetical protein